MSIEVLTVSSKGQVVLPVEMRKKLAIGNGTKLAVYASDDVIMLKPISLPSEKDFIEKIEEARDWAMAVDEQKPEKGEES